MDHSIYKAVLKKFQEIFVVRNTHDNEATKNLESRCMEFLQAGNIVVANIPIGGIIQEIQSCNHDPIELIKNTEKALGSLLKYALNLCYNPIRQEYKQIKKYTGYFQYNIMDNFKQSPNLVDSILNAFGYEEEKGIPETLVLTRISGHILDTAFDLFLTCLELKRMVILMNYAMQQGYDVKEALNARIEIGWKTGCTEDKLMQMLRRFYTEDDSKKLDSKYTSERNENPPVACDYPGRGGQDGNFDQIREYGMHPDRIVTNIDGSSSQFLADNEENLYGDGDNSLSHAQSPPYYNTNDTIQNDYPPRSFPSASPYVPDTPLYSTNERASQPRYNHADPQPYLPPYLPPQPRYDHGLTNDEQFGDMSPYVSRQRYDHGDMSSYDPRQRFDHGDTPSNAATPSYVPTAPYVTNHNRYGQTSLPSAHQLISAPPSGNEFLPSNTLLNQVRLPPNYDNNRAESFNGILRKGTPLNAPSIYQ